MKIVHPHSKFFIIGNADEQHSIAEKISKDDIVIRFNSPNPSCTLMADWVFVANGYNQIRHLNIDHQMFKPDTQIFFRHSRKDIYLSCFEKLPLHKRIKYFWRFPQWVKKSKLKQYKIDTISKSLYLQCVNMIGNSMPSTGFLAINYVLNQYPTHQIILHNFSFQGWSGHDWHNEKCLVQALLDKRKIKFL